MICSFPTTAKSSGGSDWLRRLRSSKGFPDSDDIDLEHFLSSSPDPQTHPVSAHPVKRLDVEQNFVTTELRDDNKGRDLLTNMLNELFCMGESNDLSGCKMKKSCRKQRRPQICVIPSKSDVGDVNQVRKERVSLPLPLNLSNRREAREVSEGLNLREHGDEDEEEQGHGDFRGFSQTEVTIIDTSVPSWKFEKTLFRRKNVWKVGEKKDNGLTRGDKKKREANLNEKGDEKKKKKLKVCSSSSNCAEGEDGDQKKKKKWKVCSSSSKYADGEDGGDQKKKKKKKRLELSPSSEYVEDEQPMVLSNSTEGEEKSNEMVAACDRILYNPSQPQEKSCLKKKDVEGGGSSASSSSVILIKSIRKSKKKTPGKFIHKQDKA